jgi:hypothetical protein
MIAWRSKLLAEQHLRLGIDQRHNAVVGHEKSFFATLRCSVLRQYSFLHAVALSKSLLVVACTVSLRNDYASE